MTQETLREEFYKRRARDEFTLSNGKLSTDKVADWWLERIAQRDKELVEKVLKLRKSLEYDKNYRDMDEFEQAQVTSEEGYNEALSDILTLLEDNQ